MFSKLEEVEQRYEELSHELSDSNVVQNRELFEKLSKEYKAQEKVVLVYRKYKKLLNDIKSNKEIISQNEDDELVSLAKEELIAYIVESAIFLLCLSLVILFTRDSNLKLSSNKNLLRSEISVYDVITS